MNDAQTLGQVFNLPDPIPTQVVRGGSGGSGAPQMNDAYFGIPDAQDGLQATGNVANDTAAYYQKLAGVRQFAQGMWQNYKIDVTKPDYSRPEAVAAAEAFKMELANAEATANQAKNSQSALTAAKSRPNTVIRSGAFQPGQYFEEQTPEQQYADFSQAPATSDTIKNYSGDVENRAIMKEEQGQVDNQVAKLRTQAEQATDPAIRKYLMGQADQILQAQNLKLNPPAETNGGYGMDDPNIKLARKYYLLSNGSPEYFKPAPGKYNSEGSQIGMSTVDKGTRMGDFTDKKGQVRPFVIDTYDYDPDSKTLIVKADNPEAEPRKIKGDKILNFLSEVAASNSGGILNGKTLRDALGKMKLLGQGDVDINGDRLLSPQEHLANAQNNESLQGSKTDVKQIRDELSTNLGKLKERGFLGIGGEEYMHVTPGGKILQVSKQDGRYHFTEGARIGTNKIEPKDLGEQVLENGKPTGDYNVEGVILTKKEINEGLTKERMADVLEQLGHTSKRIEAKAQQAAPKSYTIQGKEWPYDKVKAAADASEMTIEEYLQALK